MLIASNGMVGLFTNVGKTPVWVLVILLFFSTISLTLFCIRLWGIFKSTNLECSHCWAQLRCLYYVIQRDGRKIPYIWWPKFFLEIFVHISYVTCSIVILIFVTKGNHKEKKVIGISFTIWVLINTGFALVLSIVENHISNLKMFLLMDGQLEEIQENLSIPPLGNEKIMERVDPPNVKTLVIGQGEVEVALQAAAV